MRAVHWLMGLLALHLLLSAAYVGTIGRTHRAVELDAKFLADDAPLPVLVAGDSHARNAVDADRLGGLSVAVGGEHVIKTRYRLPWLLDRSPREVQAVLLSFDAASLSSWKTDSFEPEAVWGRYVPFLELGWRRAAPFEYGARSLKAHAIPYAGEIETIAQYATGRQAFQDDGDPARLQAPPPVWARRDGEEAARSHFEDDRPIDRVRVWAMRSLIQLLRDRGIQVVLVSYPVTLDYARTARELGFDPETRRKVVADLLEPGRVDHLDYEGLYFDRENAFYDGDHLNGRARLHFTDVLAQDLRALGILAAP